MERYVNSDGSIAKYVHNDGSETSIKTWPEGMKSCGGSEREKFNVFISVSTGCFVKCSFCFLTSKGYPYKSLPSIAVANNVCKAIEQEMSYRPHLKDLPMNLSFMGMGDAWMNLEDAERIVGYITSWFNNQMIEGVDIATTMPKISYDDIKILEKIKSKLQNTGRLVPRPSSRTPVRIFYSLFSVDDDVRNKHIPNSLSVFNSLMHLSYISDNFNVIFHILFLDGVNDNDTEIDNIISLSNDFEFQLRLLRFNRCPNTRFKESSRIENIISTLSERVNDFKYQLSPGSEISAACGMFLMKDMRK